MSQLAYRHLQLAQTDSVEASASNRSQLFHGSKRRAPRRSARVATRDANADDESLLNCHNVPKIAQSIVQTRLNESGLTPRHQEGLTFTRYFEPLFQTETHTVRVEGEPQRVMIKAENVDRTNQQVISPFTYFAIWLISAWIVQSFLEKILEVEGVNVTANTVSSHSGSSVIPRLVYIC